MSIPPSRGVPLAPHSYLELKLHPRGQGVKQSQSPFPRESGSHPDHGTNPAGILGTGQPREREKLPVTMPLRQLFSR